MSIDFRGSAKPRVGCSNHLGGTNFFQMLREAGSIHCFWLGVSLGVESQEEMPRKSAETRTRNLIALKTPASSRKEIPRGINRFCNRRPAVFHTAARTFESSLGSLSRPEIRSA